MPKSSQKKSGAKKEYTGTYRHFTLHEVNGKEVEIGTATIKDHQNPLDAAKKLLSSYYRHQDIKSNERNKHIIKFCIRETTRGHSKIYGPYKGKFIKYDKPLMIKLKSGKVIKRIGKPMVKLAKGNNNKKMMGGNGENNKLIVIKSNDELKNLINIIQIKEIKDLKDEHKVLLNSYKIDFEEIKKGKRINNNKILDINEMHYDINLSKLDVSNITSMNRLFKNFDFINHSCNDVNISNWNVSNVKNMEGMFFDSNFNQDLNQWNISNVDNMIKMFSYCRNFNTPLTWKIIKENVSLNNIFWECSKIVLVTGDRKCHELRLDNSINIYFIKNKKPTRLQSPCGDIFR